MTDLSSNAGVYYIKSRASGNMYVGSAKNMKRRWVKHLTELRSGTHHSTQLKRVVARRGLDDLEFGVMLVCAPEQALMYEQIVLTNAQPRYNSAKVAGKVDHTPEVRAKLSAAAKARWHDPQRRARYVESYTRYNTSEAGKAAHARRAKAQWQDPEYRQRLVAAHRQRCATHEAFGKRWSLKEAAETYGVSYTVLKNRIQLGWDLERALTTPKRGT